jgi:hypothetical protein
LLAYYYGFQTYRELGRIQSRSVVSGRRSAD